MGTQNELGVCAICRPEVKPKQRPQDVTTANVDVCVVRPSPGPGPLNHIDYPPGAP